MSRIVWSNIEKGAVFAAMVAVFKQFPMLSRKEALSRTQSIALQSHRWIVVTDQRVFNYKDRIEIARQKALQELKKKPPEAIVAPLNGTLFGPAPILAPTPAPERKETPKGRLADILELLLDVVAESVAARVNRKILEAIPEAPVAHRPKHDPQPIPHPTGVAKPGVLVIGLLASQAYAVISTWGTRLDLTFMTPEDAVHRPKLVRAHTVLMTKFINHSVQDKYRKAPKLHFVNGGIGELGEVLDSITPPVL
jgi:hypothetical protein